MPPTDSEDSDLQPTAQAPGPAMQSMTESQREAITSLADCTIVIAGPGSGKTTVSKLRTIFLNNNNKHAKAPCVGLVTYTKEAAKEIESRLRQEGMSSLTFLAGTFHGLSLFQLIEAEIKISAKEQVIREAQQLGHYRAAIADSGWEGSFDEATAVFDLAGSSLDPKLNAAELRLVETYRESLRIQGKYDFSDLLRLTIEGMRNGKIARLAIDHLIVDEAQDIDELQLAWIQCYVNAGIGTTLVADDDQSIYGFRYALGLEGLRRYSSYVENSKVHAKNTRAAWIALKENFRSGSAIVQCSQLLISHGKYRIDKKVRATRRETGRVECFNYKCEEDELTRLALTVKLDANEWAVLARTNTQLDRIELALEQRGIAYWRKPKEGIWEKDVGLIVLDLLSSLCSPDKAAKKIVGALMLLDAFRTSIATRESVLRRSDVGDVLDFVAERGANLTDSDIKKAALGSLKELWLGWHEQLRSAEKQGKTEIAKKVIGELGLWVQPILVKAKTPLLKAIIRCLQKRRGYLASRIKAPTFKAKNPGSGVYLSTMHGSKGLEFPNVWVFGLDAKSEDEWNFDEIEEERRLVYVAFTRAKDRLVASYVESNKPSMFLDEAGLLVSKTKRKRARRKIYGS